MSGPHDLVSATTSARSPHSSRAPSPGAGGAHGGSSTLSRRLSWNNMRGDNGSHASHASHGMPAAALQGARASDQPLDGYDLGMRIQSYDTLDGVDDPLRSTGLRSEFNSPTTLRPPGALGDGYLGAAAGSSREEFERLTPEAPDALDTRNGLGHGRTPSKRVYDDEGLIAAPLSALGRSPTIRQFSNTLRKASVRVVNIMGNEKDDHQGMIRIETRDDEDTAGSSPTTSGSESPPVPPPPRGTVVPSGGLRGRTLCLFTSRSRVRRSMDTLMRLPWVEPAILVLILVNVVVLAFQSSPPLFEPRASGYFQGWEDYVLLALFAIFTLEMFARIVLTGLIFDPDTTVSAAFASAWAYTMRWSKAEDDLGPNDKPWRRHKPTNSVKPKQRADMLREIPFEAAVRRQHGVLKEGRPYLRHSWHRIDMLAVVCFWVYFILALAGLEVTENRHIYIFRALSVLRATRLLVITSGTATILHSLKRAGPLILNVTWYVVFAAALFSIVGVQSFRGSLRRNCILTDPTNSTNVINLNVCGGHVDPTTLENHRYFMTDGAPSRIAPKGFICPINQICQETDENPVGNTVSFDNIFMSLVQVLIIAGVNTWTGTMYWTMDSDFFSSALFFIVAIIVLNFWLMNLIVAVVVNTFQDIRAETKRSAFGADQSIIRDPQWAATNKPKDISRLLKLYRKTEIFWVFLVAADLVMQACRTSSSSDGFVQTLRNLELAFTIVFDVEIIIRAVAYLPNWQGFLTSFRNDFDLFLALGCSIIQIPPIRNSAVYPWLTVFQMLRWYRFILWFPRMAPLLQNIFGSFAGLLNMIFFLFLMNFLSALMAVQLLRGDMSNGNGDMINFSQAYNSFLGMYQIFSTENWTTVLYGAMGAEWQFQQGWVVCIFLFLWFLFANFILMQMFIAVINENFDIAEEAKRKHQIEAFIRKTAPSSAHASWIERLNPYRLIRARHRAVKVDTLSPNLILPLKQSIGADVGAPEIDPDTTGGKAAMKRMFGLESEGLGVHIPMRNITHKPPPRRHSTHITVTDETDDDRGLSDLLPPINAGQTQDEHIDALRERRNQQADFIAAHPSYDKSLWLFTQNNVVRKMCQTLVPPAYGQRIFGKRAHPWVSVGLRFIVFLAVVASIVVAAIATPEYRRGYYARHGLTRASWFDLTESGLALVFVVEALIKIIADGFIFAPNAYLLSLWNVVDFVILLTIITETTMGLIVVGGVSRGTRALKSFRALRLITLFSRLRDTFHAVLFAGAIRILDASMLMILYLIPFAVWGMNIFMKRMAGCNDDDGDVTHRSECVGEFSNSPVGDIAFLAPRVWANPAFGGSVWSFDSFRSAVLILFEIVSLEGWTDVMASAMNIAGTDMQPQTNAQQWNSIFFVIFNLFGGIVILTVFLSIIIENFSRRSGAALLTTEQRQWEDLQKFIRQQTPSQLPRKKPNTPLRRWCYDRAVQKRGYWARFFTFLYFVHIVLLMTQDYSSNIMTEPQLDWTFLVLTIVYAIDLVVRFIGLGLKSFRTNGWNLFDVVVITGCFATTIPALQASMAGQLGNQASKQVQKLFLVSVALKLVQRLDSLNQLFKTSVASLPAIGNLFLLWAVLFLFFGIVYLEIFGLTKMGNSAETRFQNYHTFGNTMVMLAFMSTGEGWNGFMHDYTVEFPRCTRNDNYLNSDCGSVGWAYALFITWNILSMYIFLNMFTGVVVQSFSYVYQMPGGASLSREQIRSFKMVWAEVDKDRTGYIRRKDFALFFSKLTGVLKVRMYPTEFSVTNLLAKSAPDPNHRSSKTQIVNGARHAIDLNRLDAQIAQIDFKKVHQQRTQYVRLFNEAKMTEDPGRGISFQQMLVMLAHYKLIDDEKALPVKDLLERRARLERVSDLVNLDRVRGLLRTFYWRKRFLESRAEKQRVLAEQSFGIPAIVLEPMPTTPPRDIVTPPPGSRSPFRTPPRTPPGHSSTPLSSAPGSPEGDAFSIGSHSSYGLDGMGTSHLSHISGLSAGGLDLSRRLSNDSRLSSDTAYRREPSFEEPEDEDVLAEMSTSVWGDMMREAVDEEDT